MIIDRFENGFAVCECDDGSFYDILIKNIPADAKEGDVLIKCGSDQYKIDKLSTDNRKKKIDKLMDDLFLD